jgi:hypothetical protein
MAFAQGRRFIATALLLFPCLLGCKSKETEFDPYAAEKVVMKAQAREGAPPALDAAQKQGRAEADLAAAEAAWRTGDALTALSIANHALIEGVPREFESAFRDLRSRARAAVLATKICRVRVLPEKDVVADGEAVGLRLSFENLSNTLLSVPRAQKGSSDAMVVLTLSREDFDVFGNSRRAEFTLPVPVREDLALEPGRAKESRLVVPAEMAKLSHEGFSVIELTGTFRPVVMRIGESEFFDAIPVERAKFRIFQKGFEPLADDPLGSLKRAVLKRSPPHVFAAAELLAPTDRAAARTFLETARAKDPEMGRVIDASLARLAATR